MVVEVPLTRGLVALVDDADEEIVRRHRWHAKEGGKTWYAERWVPLQEGGERRWQVMHMMLTGYSKTDHINGNGLDNRRLNLRPATEQDNHRNRRKTPSSSRFKGVSWHKHSRCWTAQIAVARRRPKWLGRFQNEVDAAMAYDAAARHYFGAFAALNFPRPGERSALD